MSRRTSLSRYANAATSTQTTTLGVASAAEAGGKDLAATSSNETDKLLDQHHISVHINQAVSAV